MLRFCLLVSSLLFMAGCAAPSEPSADQHDTTTPGAHRAYVHALVGEANYSDEWDAPAAREALEAMGFEVAVDIEERLTTRERNGTQVTVAVRSSTNWTFHANYLDASLRYEGDQDGAREFAREKWREIEPEFHDLLAAFESATGWSNTGTSWAPLIAT